MKTKNALKSAISNSRSPISILVGSPITVNENDSSIPGVDGVVEMALEYVRTGYSNLYDGLNSKILSSQPQNKYQIVMEYIQSYINQDSVNEIICNAVKRAVKSEFNNLNNNELDLNHNAWHIPEGVSSLAKLIKSDLGKFSGPILTTNFDPLISLSLQMNSLMVNRIVLQSDGAIPKLASQSASIKNVIHLHGYWNDSDTLHTPQQIYLDRPKLQNSIQNILKNHTLLVIAYGGWDDAFKKALSSLILDDSNQMDIIWCFYETSENEIKEKYKSLFELLSPAINRGRFRYYLGIDCKTIFKELNSDKDNATNLSQTPAKELSESNGVNDEKINCIERMFKSRFSNALKCFHSQRVEWVDPIVSESRENDEKCKSLQGINLDSFVMNPCNTIIKAPPQFGLTCLSHYLCCRAIEEYRKVWIRVDLDEIKPHQYEIASHINAELEIFGIDETKIKCIVFDSWSSSKKDHVKCLNKLRQKYVEIPFVVMQRLDSMRIILDEESIEFQKGYKSLFLWALSHNNVRTVVTKYNEMRRIGDDDSVTKRVVLDLDTLNLHRTPLNCLTLLKVSEIDFDESPVNRTEVIQRILLLLFNSNEIPTYKSKPDVKDCEYILGYFCERLVNDNRYYFSYSEIKESLIECCKSQIIEIDVQLVIDILMANTIIVARGSMYSFKYSYWVYYFAAKRMHHSPSFAKIILSNLNYTKFPEIIEFYTGIDRQRNDALEFLTVDLKQAHEKVSKKCNLPFDFNPLDHARWSPTGAQLEKMKEEINTGISESNLPSVVKDAYSDENYDRARPYNQEIRTLLYESDFINMTQTMAAAARALRNSDYADPGVKRKLISEIMLSWEQASKVILVIMPLLAANGNAVFDGAGFILCGDFGETPEKRVFQIISEIPSNMVRWYQDDIYSTKMVPLLRDQIQTSKNNLIKHNLNLILIKQRPNGWEDDIHHYMNSLQKNSFYLFDLHLKLRNEYRYSYVNATTLNKIGDLIKLCLTKHFAGIDKPTLKDVKKVITKDVLPERMSPN